MSISGSLYLCFKLANMLLKASLKNANWILVKEIMRFISSIDPADFENGDVFEIGGEQLSPQPSIMFSIG